MTQRYESNHEKALQEHLLMTVLLAELQEIDEKQRVEARFYALIA
jgi:hypothetical protein